MSVVRRVRMTEWPLVRDLRLRALADPDASLAFLDTVDSASAQPDSFWQERTAGGAIGTFAAQFIVEGADGWTGSATLLRQVAGSADEMGGVRPADRMIVVGVYVDPAWRGEGLVDALLHACAAQARDWGFDELFLDVHSANARAIAAYQRCGFVATGVEFDSVIGHEIEMVRGLAR